MKAIEQTKGGLRVGQAYLCRHGLNQKLTKDVSHGDSLELSTVGGSFTISTQVTDLGAQLQFEFDERRGSVRQATHDGDTVTVEMAGNLSVRFLGIDTPEISFPLPDSPTGVFPQTDSQGWIDYLKDPFASADPNFLQDLGDLLRAHLEMRFGPNAATQHHELAEKAEDALEALVEADIAALQQTKENFRFFMSFANEVMDGYGRLLCFINRNQPATPPERPLSYNERLLASGDAFPYFIWPNLNPFLKQKAILDMVPPPGDIGYLTQDELGAARAKVASARKESKGVFAHQNLLAPFELRFLSRQAAPSRWVIDLSNPSTDVLLHPTQYHFVANPEDRLFVPPEYVPLFVEAGWRRMTDVCGHGKCRKHRKKKL